MANPYVLLVTKAQINKAEKALNGFLGRWFKVDSETLDQNGDIDTVSVVWRMIYKEVGGKGVINAEKLVDRYKKLSTTKKTKINQRFGINLRTWYLDNRVRLATVKFPEVI